MRKIRIAEHISLDGVIQPGGPDEDSEYAHGGWTAPYRTAEGAAATAEAYGKGFDLLLGRRTYDLWASFWPKVKGGPFADSLNAATKYVATHRPVLTPEAPRRATPVREKMEKMCDGEEVRCRIKKAAQWSHSQVRE